MDTLCDNLRVGDTVAKGSSKLRVVVADDTPASLLSLATLLRTEFEVVAERADGISALQAIKEFKPDVAVLDLSMPGLNGIEIARELRTTQPRPAVIICSVHCERQLIEAALEAGVRGYVSKIGSFQDLVPAVETVASGKQFLSCCFVEACD